MRPSCAASFASIASTTSRNRLEALEQFGIVLFDAGSLRLASNLTSASAASWLGILMRGLDTDYRL